MPEDTEKPASPQKRRNKKVDEILEGGLDGTIFRCKRFQPPPIDTVAIDGSIAGRLGGCVSFQTHISRIQSQYGFLW